MAAGLTGAVFETKYNNSSTGLYKTGQVDGIGSDDHRNLVTDIKDNFFNKTDGLSGNVIINGSIRHTNHIGSSPASDQDDFNPSSWVTSSSVLRIDPSADIQITGIVAGLSGKVGAILNVSDTYWITLKNESSSSTAANRFHFGQDIIIEPNSMVSIWYDLDDGRWRTYDIIGVQTKKTFIQSSEVLSLNSTPKELIPAPGAGKIIQPISVSVFLDYGSAAYTTNTNLQTYLNGPSAIQVDYSNTILAATADAYHTAGKAATAFTAQDLTNVAYMANVLTGNPATGDSDITIYVTYKIITV